MATLQTGSGQLSQRIDPGLVDPRLLAADFSRIGQGIEQGMGLANNFATMRENAQMRPIRGALANFELAKAEEFAAQAANRGALADLNIAALEAAQARMPLQDEAFAFRLAQEQEDARIKAMIPRVISEGTSTSGGFFSSPDGRFLPRETIRSGEAIVNGQVVPFSNVVNMESSADVQNRLNSEALDRRGKEAAVMFNESRARVGDSDPRTTAAIPVQGQDAQGNTTVTFFNNLGEKLGTQITGVVPVRPLSALDQRIANLMAGENAASNPTGAGGQVAESRPNPFLGGGGQPAAAAPVQAATAMPVVAEQFGDFRDFLPRTTVGASTPAAPGRSAGMTAIVGEAVPAGKPAAAPSPLDAITRKPTQASTAKPASRAQTPRDKAAQAFRKRQATETLAEISKLVADGGATVINRDGSTRIVQLSPARAKELEKERLAAIKTLGL